MAIITISRGTFSGGKALAECLAERMNYPILSREETLAEAGREYGISEEELSSALGDPPHFWQQMPGRRMAYLRCLTAVLLRRTERGNLVYHGHAGHFLLTGITHVIRVRVIADMEFRVKAAMAQMKCGWDEAVSHIEKVDKKREKWTRFLYGVGWEDPALYDAVLNLHRMSIEGACFVIMRMAELDDFRVTPASGKTQEDLLLGSRVWIALAKDESTKAAFVTVEADDGKVTIKGSAGSQKVMDALPLSARKVQGVREVSSEVGVGSDWYW